ncbi:hypothetical protein LSUE1_G005950 [Lachnellula suecica]|uniref:Uncharacterized protein n=1 Tax=Lachnellula suecica TaxID=602035 RepID=A0A8T9BYN7_9HELO|nr:hypothetical protein LSUE1_G005950 [Lachnellula suecica]
MPAVRKVRKHDQWNRDPATGRFRTALRTKQSSSSKPARSSIQKVKSQEVNDLDQKQYRQLQHEHHSLLARFHELDTYGRSIGNLRAELDNLKARCKAIEHSQNESAEEVNKAQELLNNMEEWPQDITSAVRSGWDTRHKSRYKKGVKVLLVCWMSDDLGVLAEVNILESVFRDYYHYEVSKFRIPDDRPTTILSDCVKEFIANHCPETLLIFYYTGHGSIDLQRNDTIWSATREHDSPQMPASLIQTLLEETPSDAILLHDSCESADIAVTKATNNNKSVTELIAACGFQTTAPFGPGSFTNALIATLRLLSRSKEPFSVSDLFNCVLAQLRWAPNRREEAMTTPVHCTLTSDRSGRRIMLEPNVIPRNTLRAVPGSRPEAPTQFLMLSLKLLKDSDHEALREWILKAPPGALEIDLNKPKIGQSYSRSQIKWAGESDVTDEEEAYGDGGKWPLMNVKREPETLEPWVKVEPEY